MHALRGRLRHPGSETGAEEQEDVGGQAREEDHDAEEERGAGDDRGAAVAVGQPAHGQDAEHQEGAGDPGHEHDDARAHSERRLDVGREDAQAGALEVVQGHDDRQDHERRGAGPSQALPQRRPLLTRPRQEVLGKEHLLFVLGRAGGPEKCRRGGGPDRRGSRPEDSPGTDVVEPEGSLTLHPTRMFPVALPGPPMDSSWGCYARMPDRHQNSRPEAGPGRAPTTWRTWRRTPRDDHRVVDASEALHREVLAGGLGDDLEGSGRRTRRLWQTRPACAKLCTHRAERRPTPARRSRYPDDRPAPVRGDEGAAHREPARSLRPGAARRRRRVRRSGHASW